MRCFRRALAGASIADMRDQRRVKDLDGFEVEGLYAVVDAFARTEKHRRDVEGEFVDDARDQRLTDG